MDLEGHFDKGYQITLEEIKNNFQENLTARIKGEIDRNKSLDFSPRQFTDAGFAINEKSICYYLRWLEKCTSNELQNSGGRIKTQFFGLLQNISLRTRPDLSLQKFAVDFKNQCLYIDFKFEHLQVTTDYQLSCLSSGGDVNKNGSMRFDFNLSVTGPVGIFFTEDSFSPINYDVKYDIGSLKLEINPQENIELFNLTPKDPRPIDTKLLSLLWPALRDHLYYEIYKLVSGSVVDYSVSELLIDEPEHLKKYAEIRIEHGNLIIDQCLKDFNSFLEKQTYCSETFSINIGSNQFRCGEGKLLKPFIKRTSNTSFINNEKENYYADVILDQYEYAFINSDIKRGNEPFQGDVNVKPYRNKMSFKVSISSGKKCLSVEMIDVLDWYFETEPKNEGIKNFIENDLKPYLAGFVWHHTNDILQKSVEQFNAAY